MLNRLKSTKFSTWYNKHDLMIVIFTSFISIALFAIIVVNIALKNSFLYTFIAIAFAILAILKLLEICFTSSKPYWITTFNCILLALYIMCVILNLL